MERAAPATVFTWVKILLSKGRGSCCLEERKINKEFLTCAPHMQPELRAELIR